MNSITISHRTPDGLSPTNLKLLRNPLDFIAEDHLRLRTMCAELDRLATCDVIEQAARDTVVEYLTQELPLLLADEDDDLMPRVHARAEPEDEAPKLFKRLQEEHAQIADLMDCVTAGLKTLQSSQPTPEELSASMRELANASRRHLILENAVLMPLARARLTRIDLVRMRTAMLKRRGLDDLFKS